MPGNAAKMPGGPGTRSVSTQVDPTKQYHRVPAADYPETNDRRTSEAPRNPWRRHWLRCLQRLKSNKKAAAVVGVPLLLLTLFTINAWFPFFGQGCPVRPHCPDYSVHFKARCYYLNETREDWHTSNRSCFLNKGSLAVFETPKDLEFLLATFAHAVPWIGLYEKRDVYLWVDGQAFNENTFKLVIREGCAYIDCKSITTTSCDLPKAFICMKMM